MPALTHSERVLIPSDATIDQGMKQTRNGEMEERNTEERRTQRESRKQNKGAQHLLPNYRFHHIAQKHRKNRLTAQQWNGAQKCREWNRKKHKEWERREKKKKEVSTHFIRNVYFYFGIIFIANGVNDSSCTFRRSSTTNKMMCFLFSISMHFFLLFLFKIQNKWLLSSAEKSVWWFLFSTWNRRQQRFCSPLHQWGEYWSGLR